MFEPSTSDEHALPAPIAQALRDNPQLYHLLVMPEPSGYQGQLRLRDLVDSLALEGNLDRPEDIITLLHALSRPTSLVSLTTRECDVLQLLVTGLSNREIACALTVTVNTVKTHLNSIYGKLDVHNRMEAAVRARELGLL